MPGFRVSSLPKETKKLHESQKGWKVNNWKKTLGVHNQEVEECIEKINLFDIWSNTLRDDFVAKKIIPEIITDAYISIHFAGYGLYKYAYMCLRSELETGLRLVYFSKHEIEYNWWSEGDEWFRGELSQPNVWPGHDFNYFKHIPEVKKFERLCSSDSKKLFFNVKKSYKNLSKFIHTGAEHFQTSAGRLSPKYDVGAFNKWKKSFDEVQSYIHTILALGFPTKFKGIQESKRNKILNIGSGQYFKERVEQVFEL